MRSDRSNHDAILHAALRAAALGLAFAGATAAFAGEPWEPAGHSDAERAREYVRRGEYVPLEQIVADALARHPGRVVEAELDDDEYEVELLTDEGVQVELEYDARTGRLLEVEYDD